MTESTTTVSDTWQRTIELPTGCTVRVDEYRSLVELPIPRIRGECGENAKLPKGETAEERICKRSGWQAISSAILKGGLRSFGCPENGSGSHETSEGTTTEPESTIRVFNYKVPSTYDGLHPEPKALLRNAIAEELASETTKGSALPQDATTIGIMTAASMKSLRTATRSAGGIVVDAIVTAGISNARAAGASADFFGILPETGREEAGKDDASREDAPKQRPPPGTINTIVVVNGASLTQEALIEAYAIAIEAKCGACADYSVACAKSSSRLAQGTGTDCAVLLCPSLPSGVPASEAVAYSGKHCLLAELIGQAVREATGAAIVSNLEHLYHGSMVYYHLHRCLEATRGILRGARPCVPARPTDPVPRAPGSVVGLGLGLVFLCYGLSAILPRLASVLLAAAAWDRCLSEPPLSIHPVVLAGTTISLATKRWIPQKVFEIPWLGFCGGVAFLVSTLLLFGSGAYAFVWSLQWAEATTAEAALGGTGWQQGLVSFLAWVLEVALVKTTFSLQLLCTIALQMARFLERAQLFEARSQLSWLCSRDPTHLNSEELAGGTLESLSENLSDGTIAPWFWYIFFGPVGALGYRVANTLDSRIGYRGGRYEWFGKASARFDDLINLVPARLTALFLCVASALVPGCSPSRGLQTAISDRRQCSSPNAGWPMGAMAGILGVRLEKKGHYCLGKNIVGGRDPTPWDIRKGHQVTQFAGGIALATAVCACSVKEWITS